jgi:hypothetical protein
MRLVCAAVLSALALGTLVDDANAQRRNRNPSFNNDNYGNRFFLEPYGGALKDAYDISADDDIGYLVGVRAGLALGSRFRLLGNLGYSITNDVSDPNGLSSYYTYDNVWVVTTGGAEFDVVPGRTSAALGLQGGVAWRRLDLDETVGAPALPPEGTDTYAAYEVIIPSLTARHRVTSRASIAVGLYDHIFNALDGTALHSPAVTLGLTFR